MTRDLDLNMLAMDQVCLAQSFRTYLAHLSITLISEIICEVEHIFAPPPHLGRGVRMRPQSINAGLRFHI